MKRERGFTLIELLVVIAILSVLFGLTALALNGVGDNAQEQAARAEADMVQTALEVCEALDSCSEPSAAEACYVYPDSQDFAEYLRRAPKYYVAWDGANTIISVYEDSACTTLIAVIP